MEYIYYEGCRYEVVPKMTLGYQVWNIGAHMAPGYVPLCRLKAIQPYDGAAEIELDTLRAVKSDHASIILVAAAKGAKTLKDLEKRRYESPLMELAYKAMVEINEERMI